MSMGLMDSLMGAAGQAAMDALKGNAAAGGSSAPGTTGALGGMNGMALVGALLQQTGGLSGLLEKFQSQGMGAAVQSWKDTGENLPLSGQQVTQALGPDLLQNLVTQFGGSSPELAQLVAQFLPLLIDQLTPKGQLPADNGLGGLGDLGGLGNLAGLAGKLFG
jgi:uncharacterized protein YidB (DUF937 family)